MFESRLGYDIKVANGSFYVLGNSKQTLPPVQVGFDNNMLCTHLHCFRFLFAKVELEFSASRECIQLFYRGSEILKAKRRYDFNRIG